MGRIRDQALTEDQPPAAPTTPGTSATPRPNTPRSPWQRLLRRETAYALLALIALLGLVFLLTRPTTQPITRQSSACTTRPFTQTTQAGAAPTNSQPGASAQTASAQIILMPTSLSGLMQPAVDAQGNVWVGEMTTNKLARIAPNSGTVLECMPPGGEYNIMATVVDGQGNVWFTEQAANYIGRFDPTTETFKTYPLDTAIGPRMAPQDLQFDASGKLWFTLLGGRIGRLDPATGALQSWAVPIPAGETRAYPFSLAVTPQGIWFGYLSGGTVGRLDPATGKVTLTKLAHAQAAVYAMVADHAGHVWFTEMQPATLGQIDLATGKVTEQETPTLLGDPSLLYSLVAAPDGAVWFTSAGTNAVVRYQPSKDFYTFYRLPSSQSIPFGLAIGHNGTVWISGDGGGDNYVAKVTP